MSGKARIASTAAATALLALTLTGTAGSAHASTSGGCLSAITSGTTVTSSGSTLVCHATPLGVRWQ
jgi:hypothetical protein